MKERFITFSMVALVITMLFCIPERKVYRVEQSNRMYPVLMNGREFKQFERTMDTIKKNYSYNYSVDTRTVEVDVFY